MATKAKHKARSRYRYHTDYKPKTARNQIFNGPKNTGLLASLLSGFIKPTARESKTRREAAD